MDQQPQPAPDARAKRIVIGIAATLTSLSLAGCGGLALGRYAASGIDPLYFQPRAPVFASSEAVDPTWMREVMSPAERAADVATREAVDGERAQLLRAAFSDDGL